MTLPSLRPLLLLVPLSLALPTLCASGCGTACTSNIIYSVTVEVVDAKGAAVPDATVTFTIDGGPSQDCSGGGGTFECGADLPGHFVITASHGGVTKTGEEDVADNGCHVVNTTLTLTFPS